MIETTACFPHSDSRGLNSLRGWCSLLQVLVVCGCFALGAAGCRGSRTSPVNGVVLLDGKPLADASVQFISESDGRTATGQTDQEGKFSMSTYEPRDGVLPGSYKVVVSPPMGTPDPAKYSTAEDAMTGASKAAKKSTAPEFPQKYTRADQTPLKQEVPVTGSVTLELSSK